MFLKGRIFLNPKPVLRKEADACTDGFGWSEMTAIPSARWPSYHWIQAK